MAVTSCILALTGHRFSWDGRYTILYNVETNDRDDQPQQVLFGAQTIGGGNDQVADWGDQYNIGNDFDGCSYATGFEVVPRGETFPRKWRIAVDYERLIDGQQFVDPVKRLPLYWIESQHHSRLTWKKFDPQTQEELIIRNSAELMLPDPVEVDSANVVLRAVKNFRTIAEIRNLSTQLAYTVNGVRWPPSLAQYEDDRSAVRTWLCHPIESSQLQVHGFYQYATASFRFEWNRDTWNHFVLDRGVVYTDGDKIFQQHDDNGFLSAEVVNLDGAGNKLPDGSKPVFVDEPNGIQLFRQDSWTFLGLNP